MEATTMTTQTLAEFIADRGQKATAPGRIQALEARVQTLETDLRYAGIIFDNMLRRLGVVEHGLFEHDQELAEVDRALCAIIDRGNILVVNDADNDHRLKKLEQVVNALCRQHIIDRGLW